MIIIIVISVLERFLSMRFTVGVNFFPQMLVIYPRCGGGQFLSLFVFVRAGFDVGAIYEYGFCLYKLLSSRRVQRPTRICARLTHWESALQKRTSLLRNAAQSCRFLTLKTNGTPDLPRFLPMSAVVTGIPKRCQIITIFTNTTGSTAGRPLSSQ